MDKYLVKLDAAQSAFSEKAGGSEGNRSHRERRGQIRISDLKVSFRLSTCILLNADNLYRFVFI